MRMDHSAVTFEWNGCLIAIEVYILNIVTKPELSSNPTVVLLLYRKYAVEDKQ